MPRQLIVSAFFAGSLSTHCSRSLPRIVTIYWKHNLVCNALASIFRNPSTNSNCYGFCFSTGWHAVLTGLVADSPAQLNSRRDKYIISLITNLDHERQLLHIHIGKFSQNGVYWTVLRTYIMCIDILDIVTSMDEAHSLFFYSMFCKKPVQPAQPPPVREPSKPEPSTLWS